MTNSNADLFQEIERVFKIQKQEIKNWKPLEGSNYVCLFIVRNKKYVIRKLTENNIMEWRQEKAAYEVLKPLNITDELISYENGIKITVFFDNSNTLSFNEQDQIESLELLRKVHESGVSINYNYDFLGNVNKYILQCDSKFIDMLVLDNCISDVEKILEILDTLNVSKVLCHGDACVISNFLRLPDESIKLIDWEQAGMADPFLDIAIAALNQGIENINPVWSLRQYLKRTPNKKEFLRLYLYLTLHCLTMMVWCLSNNDTEGYIYFKKYRKKYFNLAFEYIVIVL